MAGLAVIDNEGSLIIQTPNWDISSQTKDFINLFKGSQFLTINNVKFIKFETHPDEIICNTEAGMGFIFILRCIGGYLIAYGLPNADTSKALNFLIKYKEKIKIY